MKKRWKNLKIRANILDFPDENIADNKSLNLHNKNLIGRSNEKLEFKKTRNIETKKALSLLLEQLRINGEANVVDCCYDSSADNNVDNAGNSSSDNSGNDISWKILSSWNRTIRNVSSESPIVIISLSSLLLSPLSVPSSSLIPSLLHICQSLPPTLLVYASTNVINVDM
jgi:hypothetical protein